MSLPLPFLDEKDQGAEFQETATVGSFTNVNATNDFDSIFEEACTRLEQSSNGISFMNDFTKADVLKDECLVGNFKDDLLKCIEEDCNAISEKWGDQAGTAANLYGDCSQLFDNKVKEFLESAQQSGAMHPIKTIDFPIMMKEHVANSFKDVIGEEITPSLMVKKHIEHHWVYSRKDPSKKWEYPQCFFDDSYLEIMEAGRGEKLSTDAVILPLFNYNIVEELTKATDANRETIQMNITIDAVEVTDGTKVTLRNPMYVNIADGMWLNGNLKETYTDQSGTEQTLEDSVTGTMDWISNTTTLSSANNQVVKVYFNGRLSNERNENTVRHSYTRENRDFYCAEGFKTDAGYSVEQLQAHKALLNLDLYTKSYNDLVRLITDMEDSDGYGMLDEHWKKFSNLQLDPLQWNPMVIESEFDCDSTTKTVALPSEYIAKELKFKIDRFITDIADTVKMEGLRFVMYGNPRFIALLDPAVKWIFKAGQRVGGVKLTYSYGVMTSGETNIFVVSSMKINAASHQMLRFIPFASDKETITFKRYKFSTDIITSKDSAYKDPDVVGGTQTYVWGTSRYVDVQIQAIQAGLNIKNANFIDIK